MILKKFKNKKILASIFGVVFFVLGIWAIQAQTTEAATTSAEFIRIKIDSTSGTELWNFFATDNGSFDEFSIPNSSTFYSTEFPDYTCGLLLTEEFTDLNDDDYILWAKKGTILGSKASLFADVTDYKACCVESNFVSDSCTMDTNANCNTNVYTNSNYVFQKAYGTLNTQECNDDDDQAPCDNTPADCCALSYNYLAAEYRFHYGALCANNGKWLITDMPDVCASDGTNNYFATGTEDGRIIWTKCTAGCDVVTGCIGGPAPPGPAGPGGGIVFESPSKFTDLMELVGSLVNSLAYLAIALAVLMLVIAGFIFLTAGGDPNRVTIAKTLILYTIIALLIIILAKAIAGAIKLATG